MKININDPIIELYGLTITEFIVYCVYISEDDKTINNICYVLKSFHKKEDTVYRIIKRLELKGAIKPRNDKNLYLMCDKNKTVMKIGISDDASKRLKHIQTSNPMVMEVLFEIKDMGFLESEIHERFNKLRLSGEWFTYDNSIYELFSKLNIKE